MSKVFILEQVNFSLKNAEDYGELLYVFSPNSQRCSIWDREFGECVIDRLEENDYDPREDYLLVAGKIVSLSIVVASVAAAYGEIALLLFSSNLQRYVPRTIGDGL